MITMNDTKLDSPKAIKTFLSGICNVEFQISKEQRYIWISNTIKRTGYLRLTKAEKSIILEYMQKMTGYSFPQLKRLVGRYSKTGQIKKSIVIRNSFSVIYTREDKLLLAETDEAHQTLSGPATKKLLERAYFVYKDPKYKRLAFISSSHLYNLRKSKTYENKRHYYTKTQKSSVKIGERRKPDPEGKPGYIRIDTVHQGDQDKQKGVYHINAVDEVTQFEVVCSVEKISENFLIPVLEILLNEFPFIIINFHSDNGSEYINRKVAKLLSKLHIEMTKSRARHSNDNALAECKNGAIVRKILGYMHIPQKYAPLINEFNINYLTPYLNFHRPCYFAKTTINEKGKEEKIYLQEDIMTPYEKLKSLHNPEQYLKAAVSFEQLEKKAMAQTDLDAAKKLRIAQNELFKKIV